MIKDFLKETFGGNAFSIRPIIECSDGFKMSVQASNFHYCEPREDLPNGKYKSVEIGFPNMCETLILDYAETPEDPTGTVYGYVPVDIVDRVIEKHGGIKS